MSIASLVPGQLKEDRVARRTGAGGCRTAEYALDVSQLLQRPVQVFMRVCIHLRISSPMQYLLISNSSSRNDSLTLIFLLY